MAEIYVYVVELPFGINEMVTPCIDGYTIYISDRLDMDHARKAYEHALFHINNLDFEKDNVNRIEAQAHENCKNTIGIIQDGPVYRD